MAEPDGPRPASRVLRRLAHLSFWFFLLKGLLWLLVPAAVWFGWRVEWL